MDKLWGVFCENFGENWPCYNGTVLYLGKYWSLKFQCLALIGIILLTRLWTVCNRLKYIFAMWLNLVPGQIFVSFKVCILDRAFLFLFFFFFFFFETCLYDRNSWKIIRWHLDIETDPMLLIVMILPSRSTSSFIANYLPLIIEKSCKLWKQAIFISNQCSTWKINDSVRVLFRSVFLWECLYFLCWHPGDMIVVFYTKDMWQSVGHPWYFGCGRFRPSIPNCMRQRVHVMFYKKKKKNHMEGKKLCRISNSFKIDVKLTFLLEVGWSCA